MITTPDAAAAICFLKSSVPHTVSGWLIDCIFYLLFAEKMSLYFTPGGLSDTCSYSVYIVGFIEVTDAKMSIDFYIYCPCNLTVNDVVKKIGFIQ